MSRYRGPRLRIVRRLGLLPSFTRKKTKKRKTPGEHGKFIQSDKKKGERRQPPQYLLRLQEKQKLRYNYGITDSQLLRYVRQARKLKGSTGEVLFQLLEMRLDNIVFRLGMAPTIVAARQLISHGHIIVNKKKINIPSYQCQPKDIITSADKKQSRRLISAFLEQSKRVFVPRHLSVNKKDLIGVVNTGIQPNSARITLNKRLIVEYYSRKV